MVENKDIQFFVENMKMKIKRDKKIDLPRRGFEPQIFEQIPAQNLNSEGDQINRVCGSQNFSTLCKYNTLQPNTHFFVSRASSHNSKSCFVLGHCPVVSLSARELVNAGQKHSGCLWIQVTIMLCRKVYADSWSKIFHDVKITRDVFWFKS